MSAADVNRHTGGHWGIENKSHYIRDAVYREDNSQAWAAEGPHTLASLRNLTLGLFRLKKRELHQGNHRMGLPRPDAGTPVHDYLASRQSRLVMLDRPWSGPALGINHLGKVECLGLLFEVTWSARSMLP